MNYIFVSCPRVRQLLVVIYGEKRYNINNAIKAYYDGIFDVFEYFLEERWTYAISTPFTR